MAEEPDVKIFRGGVGAAKDKAAYPTPTAEIRHRGVMLRLRFAGKDDTAGAGPLMSVELLPDVEQLEPDALRQFIPDASWYLAYARSVMRMFSDPEPGETIAQAVARKRQAVLDSAAPLRELGGPGRKLPDSFYRRIADLYNDLIAEGEPHPIKAIKQMEHVTMGAASRWVQGARDRGYLPAKEEK